MVRRLIWSEVAQGERGEAFEFWNQRTGNKNYSRKLNRLFKKSLGLLKRQAWIGKATEDDECIRYLVVENYLLFYEITAKQIEVLAVWYGRRDPAAMERRIKEFETQKRT